MDGKLLTRDDQIRIMELGLARVVEESMALTSAGDLAGSLQYAAPEQAAQPHPGLRGAFSA